jgi:hypothetical protein
MPSDGEHMQKITQARLHALFTYDPSTGILSRCVTRGSGVTGRQSGNLSNNGYLQMCIDYQRQYAHRMVWLYVHGVLPSGAIDHIDGDRTNNRISNLRDVSVSLNNQNKRQARSDNKSSGVLGVSKAPKYSRKPWLAKIQISGRTQHLGTFETVEQAHAAYIAAKREYHQGCTI